LIHLQRAASLRPQYFGRKEKGDVSIRKCQEVLPLAKRRKVGPVPATGKSTTSDYVYAVTMDDDDKVAHMTKTWSAPWALRELGWAE
jgi:hypothetical protein